MNITASNYFMDIMEKGCRFFFYSYKIGIQRLDNGKKTLPSFDRVITSDKYIFVEVNGCWGILNQDLSLIVPPLYKEIIPVKQIERDHFISSCLSNKSGASVTLVPNRSHPSFIAIQRKLDIHKGYGYNRYGVGGTVLDFFSEDNKEEEKACIYEICNNLENVETNLFVTFTNEEYQLINLNETKVEKPAEYKGYEFFELWHYKDNMFIVCNLNGTFVTSIFVGGRFSRKTLWGEYNEGFNEEGSPKIVIHRNEFVSVCYPRSNMITGFPNTKQFQDKENAFNEKCGKWALFKYYHREAENNNDWWDCYNNTGERTCFEQLTSFAFEEPMTQLQNDNEFICHGDSVDFLMRFEQKGAEKRERLKIDEKYEPKTCSQGQLNIIAFYDTIELREDGLFNVTTKDGYGLCNKDMQVIVPARYDYPIECVANMLIGTKQNRSINSIKQYGYYPCKSSDPILTSEDLADDIHYLNGNCSEGFYDLEEIIITKDVGKVKWNGLGRCRFRRFNVASENKVFCEVDGVLYTRKGYDREGKTHRKHMIELVACPTNVSTHIVMPGTIRIANCAFKDSMIETLQLPDTLEEIGVNAFYHTPNLKYIKLPKSIRNIEAQDVGKSGDASPRIEYDAHSFDNWGSLYDYMLKNGFEKKNGNIVKKQ